MEIANAIKYEATCFDLECALYVNVKIKVRNMVLKRCRFTEVHLHFYSV